MPSSTPYRSWMTLFWIAFISRLVISWLISRLWSIWRHRRRHALCRLSCSERSKMALALPDTQLARKPHIDALTLMRSYEWGQASSSLFLSLCAMTQWCNICAMTTFWTQVATGGPAEVGHSLQDSRHLPDIWLSDQGSGAVDANSLHDGRGVPTVFLFCFCCHTAKC